MSIPVQQFFHQVSGSTLYKHSGTTLSQGNAKAKGNRNMFFFVPIRIYLVLRGWDGAMTMSDNTPLLFADKTHDIS